MNAAMLLENIFEPKNINVLLGGTEPLLCELELEGKSYTCYVLQHRMICTKDEKKALIQEVLVVETEATLLELMFKKQLTIYEYFEQLPKYRVGRIAETVFKAEPIEFMESIEDRFPQPNVFIDLTKKVPEKQR